MMREGSLEPPDQVNDSNTNTSDTDQDNLSLTAPPERGSLARRTRCQPDLGDQTSDGFEYGLF